MLRTCLLATAAAVVVSTCAAGAVNPAIVTIYPVAHPKGLMVTTGGWPYCLQVRALARHTGYTLACGRYDLDGYTGYGLRGKRHLDWGNPDYLASLASQVQALHRFTAGPLVLIGVSYSGFGIATFASHHPELRPSRLIVIDSFLNLIARRASLPPKHPTASEIDAETGGSLAALEQRTVSLPGLAELVRNGTQLTIIWSTAASEKREFDGATCNRNANAGTLQALANAVDQDVIGWVTKSPHGHDLWDRGRAIMAGNPPGRQVVFRPHARLPANAVC